MKGSLEHVGEVKASTTVEVCAGQACAIWSMMNVHVYVDLESIEGAKCGCVILALCCLNCCCGQHEKAEECCIYSGHGNSLCCANMC